MSYDTRQDYQAPPRSDGPAREEAYDESYPRHERDDQRAEPLPHDGTPAAEQARDESSRYDEARDESLRYDEARDESSQYDPATARDGARDEAAPRYEPPSWHDAEAAPEHGRSERDTTPPSDLDAAQPEPAPATVVTPVGTTAAGPTAVGTASVESIAPAESTDDAGRLWPDDTVLDFQQRWREVQLRFVDDPRAAADEAQELVSEALDRFSAALSTRKGELDSWRDADGADTERMRTVVRRYRMLLDRLLGV